MDGQYDNKPRIRTGIEPQVGPVWNEFRASAQWSNLFVLLTSWLLFQLSVATRTTLKADSTNPSNLSTAPGPV
jgi:hypothetical protein